MAYGDVLVTTSGPSYGQPIVRNVGSGGGSSFENPYPDPVTFESIVTLEDELHGGTDWLFKYVAGQGLYINVDSGDGLFINANKVGASYYSYIDFDDNGQAQIGAAPTSLITNGNQFWGLSLEQGNSPWLIAPGAAIPSVAWLRVGLWDLEGDSGDPPDVTDAYTVILQPPFLTDVNIVGSSGSLWATGNVRMDEALDHNGSSVGLYGAAPVAQGAHLSGGGITAAAIYAQLELMGIFAAA